MVASHVLIADAPTYAVPPSHIRPTRVKWPLLGSSIIRYVLHAKRKTGTLSCRDRKDGVGEALISVFGNKLL